MSQVAKITKVNSEDIGFLEFTPADYGSQKHPVIIFLHGIGERGNGKSEIQRVAANGIPQLINAGATMKFGVDSFVVLSPQLPASQGNWKPYYVQAMIDYAKGNLNIDPNRIYLTGLSLGGGGCWIYAFESLANSFQIAALAPVCGTDDGNDSNACASAVAARLPIWTFHCADDTTVKIGAMEHVVYWSINPCKPSVPVIVTRYASGGHSGAWVNAYDMGHTPRKLDDGSTFTPKQNLYEWFLSNNRSGTVPPVAQPPVDPVVVKPKLIGTRTYILTVSSYEDGTIESKLT